MNRRIERLLEWTFSKEWIHTRWLAARILACWLLATNGLFEIRQAFAISEEPCCVAHAGTGCMNQACNDEVCLLDPFCCLMAWDERCALEAGVLCDACRATTACEVPLPDLDEAIICENDLPHSCDAMQEIRTLIPNLKLGGRAWSTESDRDVDWFEITLETPQLLRIELWTRGAISVAIVDGQCPPTTLAEGVDGCPSVTQACVPAGVTRVAVRSILFESIACSDERSRYTIQAELSPCTPEPLLNDRCDMALPIGVGPVVVDTTNATSEAAWLPASCDEGAGLAFTHDAWFAFTANASGIFLASTCVDPDFDSRLAVYSDCGGDLLACSDDACEGEGASAEFQLTCGSVALVRVGGWGSGGLITLSIDPVSTVECGCPADLDGSGEVDSADLGLILLEFGALGGPADLNGDGEVSSGDIGIALLSYGSCDS